MTVCTICSFSFPRLDDGVTVCQKCLARKPGLSAPELQAINVSSRVTANYLTNASAYTVN